MSADLQLEILSYQMCMLDDTWVEATHRDISALGTKKAASKMPYRLACTRVQQNLDFCEKFIHDWAFFNTVIWPKWRGITRPCCSPPS